MILFIISLIIAVAIIGLVISLVLFIFFMCDNDLWRELPLHNYNIYRLLQEEAVLSKNLKYAIHMKDVYYPKKRQAEVNDEALEVYRKTLDELYYSISRENDTFEVYFCSCILNKTKVEQIVLQAVVENGFEYAVIDYSERKFGTTKIIKKPE